MSRPEHSDYPVCPLSLLLHDGSALVVGGGKVALQKVRFLREARASVTVLAPEISPEIEGLAAEGALRHVAARYSSGYLSGHRLVFAVTDDRKTNARVLRDAKEQGVLCGVGDESWPEGDFITPAVLRHAGLTLSVSSGGASCRRSKLIRDTLSRHMRLLERADLLVIGTGGRELGDDAAERVSRICGVLEFMLLTTAARAELLAVAAAEPVTTELLTHAVGLDRLPASSRYELRGFEAFTHTAEMAACDHAQPAAQSGSKARIQAAFETARAEGHAGPVMAEWVGRMLSGSNKAHDRTEGYNAIAESIHGRRRQ